MRQIAIALLFTLFSVHCYAAPEKIEVPGSGWSVSFDAPPLSKKQESKNGSDYAFRANSGRFNLSFFVETPKSDGRSNKDCYNFYWPQSSKNPLISKESVVMTEANDYVRVQYDVVAQIEGRTVRQRNVNYYVYHNGKWVDVHISLIDPTAADDYIFSTFDKSLRLGS